MPRERATTACALLLALAGGVAGAAEMERTYAPEGRRDPFVAPGQGLGERGSCPVPGLEGVRVREVSLRGVVTSRGERLALLASPDGVGHVARVDQRLCDATVVEITPSSIRFELDTGYQGGHGSGTALTYELHP